MMYKYLVFSATHFYPGGGMRDCCGKAYTKKQVLETIEAKVRESNPDEMYQVYDIESDIVYNFEGDFDVEEENNFKATEEDIANILSSVTLNVL